HGAPTPEYADAFFAPDGVIALLGAQSPAYDALKAHLVEEALIGGPSDHLWIGRRHAPANPPVGSKDRLPLIVSYFTTGTPYEEEARHLRQSLEVLGLAHILRGV